MELARLLTGSHSPTCSGCPICSEDAARILAARPAPIAPRTLSDGIPAELPVPDSYRQARKPIAVTNEARLSRLVAGRNAVNAMRGAAHPIIAEPVKSGYEVALALRARREK